MLAHLRVDFSAIDHMFKCHSVHAFIQHLSVSENILEYLVHLIGTVWRLPPKNFIPAFPMKEVIIVHIAQPRRSARSPTLIMHPRRIEADEVRLGVGHPERVDRRRMFEEFDRLHERHAVERADDIARREAVRSRLAADRLAGLVERVGEEGVLIGGGDGLALAVYVREFEGDERGADALVGGRDRCGHELASRMVHRDDLVADRDLLDGHEARGRPDQRAGGEAGGAT